MFYSFIFNQTYNEAAIYPNRAMCMCVCVATTNDCESRIKFACWNPEESVRSCCMYWNYFAVFNADNRFRLFFLRWVSTSTNVTFCTLYSVLFVYLYSVAMLLHHWLPMGESQNCVHDWTKFNVISLYGIEPSHHIINVVGSKPFVGGWFFTMFGRTLRSS